MFQIIMKCIQNFLPVYLAVSLFAINGQAQEQIGVASAVNKNTTDLTLEQERKLIDAGYEIIQNHTIETDGIGRAQMLLLDGTAFSVGPNSSVVLDKFIYNPKTAEGSLEVTARGLLRIVGGKVTKKQPALIRTNSATVGIRGGIGIIQTDGLQTNATFLYGTEMTATPNCVDLGSCSPNYATTVTEPGFSVSVESEDSEPSEPVAVTEESLDALQEELEASEEAPEEESSAEEEISEDEPAAEETSAEETQEEEAAPSEETASEETPAEETAPESTEAETETEVASDDAGDSTDIEVDESLLDSSGVSDASSDVEPEDLGTADDYEAAVELETVEADDANEDPTGEVAEEVAESTQETTVEVAPIFQVNAGESIESISENLANETLTPLVFINPGELAYTITISGPDAEFVEFDEETLTINLISAIDYEIQTTLSFTVIIESENADVSEIEVLLDVTNIDEPIELTSTLLADSFAENLNLQSAILESTAVDPEGGNILFTLSGEGSENFSVDENGNISLLAELDYETTTSYSLILTASDGINDTVFEINFSVIDIDEPVILVASTSATSFAEDSLTGINIGIASATDPEGSTITYSLSGTGSENFSVDSAGNISLVNSLDYETAPSYTLTLNVSDGVNTTSSDLIITVDDVNEVPSLSSSLAASSFAENTATGTTIATASASDPESQIITYSLSGTGSENFAVDSSGNITLASSLDYETTTSYSLTLTVSDGTNSISNTINISVADVIELSIALASSSISIDENASSGSSITTTTTTTDGSGSVTYTLSGTGSDKFAVSSDGTITTAASLDYETTTSYSLTLTATDGTNTVSKDLTVNVIDINLSLSSSLVADSQDESLAIGTTIATSSNSNAEGTVVYSLTDADNKFSIDSSTGEVTLTDGLDYEIKTSHEFTITATDGVTTTSENFTVNIQNLAELESGLLRYSANYSNVNQSGFSASATRDNNSSLSNFMLDTVVSSNDSIASSKSIDNYISSSSHTIPISTITGNGNDSSGVSLHEITYTLPVNSDRLFAPNEASTSYLIETSNASGSSASTSGSGSAIISAAHTVNGNAWFMVLNNSSSTLSATYTSGDGSSGLDYSLYQFSSIPSYSLTSGTTCSSCTLRKSGNLSNINYDWGTGSILGSISDKVLLNISGKFVIPTSLVSAGEEQIVYFRTRSDDGVALELSNSSIITDWAQHPATYKTGSFTGIAGQAYDLELYWYENLGDASLQLEYRLSTSEDWVTIPSGSFII